MPQSPGGDPCPDQTPACDGSRRRRDGAHGARRWGRVAGRRGSAAAGAASHPSRRARSLARSPRRARAARSPARSPPPLAPRAHNEAAGREVVPAAASAPLPQPMPPPAEHLALGWEAGPGGRGLGAGARPPGGGVRTRVARASLCLPPGLADLPPRGRPSAPPHPTPRSSQGSAPPTRTPAPHSSGLGLPPPAPGALRPPARPPARVEPSFSFHFPSCQGTPRPPLPQRGPPHAHTHHAPLGARADGRPDRRGLNSSKSYRAKEPGFWCASVGPQGSPQFPLTAAVRTPKQWPMGLRDGAWEVQGKTWTAE